jgi:uncharacterized protein (TIGR03435 family)
MRIGLLPATKLLLLLPFFLIGNAKTSVAAQSTQSDVYAPLAAAPDVRFEVASIKSSPPDERGSGLYIYPGARVVAHNMTVRYLIAEAYGVDESQIMGGPAWVDKIRYHIEAKPSESVASRYVAPKDPLSPPPDEIREMLQNLLAERFQLKTHVQQSIGRVYELVRNNRPLRLNPPKDKEAFSWAGAVEGGIPDGKSLRGQNISMRGLARWLTDWLGCPVFDKTGLSEAYDFQVISDSNETGLALIDGISQSLSQVGLALKKANGPVYKLVVDQVTQPGND